MQYKYKDKRKQGPEPDAPPKKTNVLENGEKERKKQRSKSLPKPPKPGLYSNRNGMIIPKHIPGIELLLQRLQPRQTIRFIAVKRLQRLRVGVVLVDVQFVVAAGGLHLRS